MSISASNSAMVSAVVAWSSTRASIASTPSWGASSRSSGSKSAERAGGFEPLRFLPRGKRAVLGLVSSKSAELEDVSDLARRLDRASRFTPLDRLGIGPQCGFASTAGGNPITADVQRRKLAQVVAAARAVRGAEG